MGISGSTCGMAAPRLPLNRFSYDPAGNRVSKSVIHGGRVEITWYVRDAQGNILSVYTYGDAAVNAKDLTQTELYVYGSSRLGMWKRNLDGQKSHRQTLLPSP